MSVFVSVEDPEGEQLGEVFEIDKIFRKFPKDTGLCLRFVDESADCSFNHVQSPILLSELEKLSGGQLESTERAECERLLKVCTKFAGKRNAYIKFYGEAKQSE